MRGQRHAPGALYLPGKTRYPLYRRLSGPQGRSGQVGKISPPPGFDSRTVQPVASLYTDYATRPPIFMESVLSLPMFWFIHFRNRPCATSSSLHYITLHYITLHTLCYVSSVTFLKASFATLYRDVILSDNSRHYSSLRPSRVTAGSSNFVAVIIVLSRWSTRCSSMHRS